MVINLTIKSTSNYINYQPLLSSKYWLSVAQGWDGQLVFDKLFGRINKTSVIEQTV